MLKMKKLMLVFCVVALGMSAYNSAPNPPYPHTSCSFHAGRNTDHF